MEKDLKEFYQMVKKKKEKEKTQSAPDIS